MHDKPVVVLDPHGVFAPLRRQVDLLVEQGFARAAARDAIAWANDVDEALDLLEQGCPAVPAATTAGEVAEGE
jgi:predicted Rossmann-fold nucleotide-binding protein